MSLLNDGAVQDSTQPLNDQPEGAVSEETQPQEGVIVPNDPLILEGADDQSQPQPEEGTAQEEEGGEDQTPNLPTDIFEFVPEKFRAEDPVETIKKLAKSYEELERYKSQLENERQQYQQALQQLIMQSQPQQQQPEPNVEDIPDDEVITGKELKEYINRILQNQIQPVLTQAQLEQAKARLKSQHPDYEQIVSTPEFREFVQTLPQYIVQIADSDPDTASWVISQFKARQAQQAQAQRSSTENAVRREKLNQLSQPETRKPPAGKVIRASELRKLMMENPEAYARMQGEIIRAIQEGRYIAD